MTKNPKDSGLKYAKLYEYNRGITCGALAKAQSEVWLVEMLQLNL